MSNIVRCRSCGAPIIFIGTPKGRMIPCDPDPVTYWSRAGGSCSIVSKDGEVIRCELDGDPADASGQGYISHFVSCPEAARHRRRKKGESK